jgi:hypothetical protein
LSRVLKSEAKTGKVETRTAEIKLLRKRFIETPQTESEDEVTEILEGGGAMLPGAANLS